MTVATVPAPRVGDRRTDARLRWALLPPDARFIDGPLHERSVPLPQDEPIVTGGGRHRGVRHA